MKIQILPIAVSKLSRIISSLFIALLALAGGKIAVAQSAGSWTIVNSPNPGNSANRLSGVDALNANDIWAVGHYVPNGGSTFENLAMHWDGSQWSVVPTPHADVSPDNILKKVVAISSGDVWAVGGHGYAYTMHWNGVAWSVVNIPPVTDGNTPSLDDISAISANDIWAVGSYASDFGRVSTLIMHWNGSVWTRVPSPDASVDGTFRSSFLWGVKAISANNVWAVGEYLLGGNSYTLIEHWDGTRWSIVPSPNHPTDGDGRLYAISAISANDMWAVGEHNITDFNSFGMSFALHWNGSVWTFVPTPHPGPQNASTLFAVEALASNDVWAVGTASNPAQGLSTFVIHWNGANWSRVQSPDVPPASNNSGWNLLQSIAAVSPGNIWTVGYGESGFNVPDITLIEHYTQAHSTNRGFDADGDGKTDRAVFRPSDGFWYTQPSLSGWQYQQWGASGDRPVPGDYDGDGKTDVAVFRPVEGNWYIRKSSGGVTLQGWGQQDDTPVPGDYDGDGRCDFAVFRPAEGNWYIRKSSGGSTVQGWGAGGDKPVAGDFDGDGKTDVAVFRPSEGNWYIKKSSGGSLVQGWGMSGDKLVQGDYDGDGKTDVAVWRPSEGSWYIRRSSGGVTVRNWGISSDVPTAGDYDGDGLTDIAVWRPSEGTWYILRSGNGNAETQYLGNSDDVPVSSVYQQQ